IRQARKLLGWPSSRLAQRGKVHSAIVRRADSVDGEPPITRTTPWGGSGSSSRTGDAPGVKLTATKARLPFRRGQRRGRGVRFRRDYIVMLGPKKRDQCPSEGLHLHLSFCLALYGFRAHLGAQSCVF